MGEQVRAVADAGDTPPLQPVVSKANGKEERREENEQQDERDGFGPPEPPHAGKAPERNDQGDAANVRQAQARQVLVVFALHDRLDLAGREAREEPSQHCAQQRRRRYAAAQNQHGRE